MRLFIQIRDGKPYEHPIMDWNFREVFPDIDMDNLPPEFSEFERVECNLNVGIYEVAEVSYQWVDNIIKDVWTLREMTNEEKIQKDIVLSEEARNKAEFAIRDTNANGSVPNVII